MVAFVSSALAAAEFHSLSPPCDHSADTPGPLIPQPGAFALGRFIQEGFWIGSPLGLAPKPRMFSASYQRYSESGDTETGRRGDAGTCSESGWFTLCANAEWVSRNAIRTRRPN